MNDENIPDDEDLNNQNAMTNEEQNKQYFLDEQNKIEEEQNENDNINDNNNNIDNQQINEYNENDINNNNDNEMNNYYNNNNENDQNEMNNYNNGVNNNINNEINNYDNNNIDQNENNQGEENFINEEGYSQPFQHQQQQQMETNNMEQSPEKIIEDENENDIENNETENNNNNNNLQNNNISNIEHTTTSISNFFPKRIKPSFFRIMNEIFEKSLESIANYLEIFDLCSLRALNHKFLFLIHNYFKSRIKFEISLITNYQEQHQNFTEIFMKNIDSQIPISNKNWLDFDLNVVTSKLKILDRNILTKLRAIKNIGKLSDLIYAPFCIIFGFNKNNKNSLKAFSWKKIAGKILNDSNLILKIQNLDLENMNDTEMLETFVFLNLPELDIDLIKNFSSDFAKLIIWCQAVVSYHILIHPYTYRNDKSQITVGSDVYNFANNMNFMINRFYKFKRFLYNLNVIKIPLADYVFNLQHQRENLPIKKNFFKNDENGNNNNNNNNFEENVSNVNYLNEELIGNVLSYLPYIESYKFMKVNKMFYKGFIKSIDFILEDIFKEIYFFKLQSYEKIFNKIPMLYSNTLFSNYFLMLDDILNPIENKSQNKKSISFFSKEQLNYLKNFKILNQNSESSKELKLIFKIFCLICDLKPHKKNDYLNEIKINIINNKLPNIMRNINKLYFTQNKINIINKDLTPFFNREKLEQIKKINLGIYQLLIWELFILEYLKIFNVFDFCNVNYIKNRYDSEEISMIKYFIEITDYLKYNLKIKFHFSTFYANYPSYNFIEFFNNLKQFLLNNGINLNMEIIFDTTNTDHQKISKIYFESKNLIPLNAKPALYERIMCEILNCYEKNENNLNFDNYNNAEDENEMNNYLDNNNYYYNNNNNQIDYNDINKSQKINNNNTPKYNSKKNILFTPMFALANKNQKLNSNSNTFLDFPNIFFIKHILFYLDINSLPNFCRVCKKSNECVKTHIFIRLLFLNKEKKMIENENSEIINNIEKKRQNFFNEFELDMPNKEHSFSLMNQITIDDVMELKSCFKKYNKTYEQIILPLLYLFNFKPEVTIKLDGTKFVSYFNVAKKFLYSPNFIKRIRDLELETIPYKIFNKVENSLGKNSNYNIKSLSPCFNHLINWVIGVIEFHRVIRKYSLSNYDYEILSEDEINFCLEMDNIVLLYYKLLRYATKHCKEYEKNAQIIMDNMNIPNN